MSEEISPSDAAFDEAFAAELAQSQRAFANYEKMLSDVDRELIGVFYDYPPRLEGRVVFYRPGLRSSATANALASMLKAQGWLEAPRGTKHRGTEFYDGDDDGLILMAPLEVHKRMQNVEELAKRKRANREIAGLDGFANEMKSMGVVIEEFDTKVGAASAPDIAANVKDARERSQARPKRT